MTSDFEIWSFSLHAYKCMARPYSSNNILLMKKQKLTIKF